MKKQLLAMLALMSIASHSAQAQLPPTFVDTFKLLGGRFPNDMDYDALRTGCAQSYDWLRTSCISLPVVANNPALQKIMKENFAAISSIAAVLGAFGTYWLANLAWQCNIRRKDNNIRESYTKMKPEERTALLLTTLSRQLPVLLNAIPESDEVFSRMKSAGVPFALKVPGYSQNALDVTVTGDTHIPIRLNFENHLGREQGIYHFTSPYRQSAHTIKSNNIGPLQRLLSDDMHLIKRMANVLANLPAQNYNMNKDGSLTVPELNRNVLSVLESDAVAKAIYELEKQPEDLNDRCRRLIVDTVSPFVTLHLESKGATDIVELALVDNVSGRTHSFIIEGAPFISQQGAAASKDRTRQVIDTSNTQRKESGLDRLKRGWRGGTVSSGRTDNLFLRSLKADGLINVIYSAVRDNPSLQTAYVVETAPNSWQIRTEAASTSDGRPICSSSILPNASSASLNNAHQVQPLPDLMNNFQLDDGDDEGRIFTSSSEQLQPMFGSQDNKPLYYATMKGLEHKPSRIN